MADDLFGRIDDIPPPEPYRLRMDGEWDFVRLSTFPRQYMQVYSFFYVLESAARGDEFHKARLGWALQAFPWRGGWSSVDFFQYLVNSVPRQHRFRIRSIQYGSPGFMEILVGFAAVAVSIKTLVSTVREIDTTYHKWRERLRKRRMWKMDARDASPALSREDVAELTEAIRELTIVLRLEDYDDLFRDLNPVLRVKILLALGKRLHRLAEHQTGDHIQY